jgi:hypothetical protein
LFFKKEPNVSPLGFAKLMRPFSCTDKKEGKEVAGKLKNAMVVRLFVSGFLRNSLRSNNPRITAY